MKIIYFWALNTPSFHFKQNQNLERLKRLRELMPYKLQTSLKTYQRHLVKALNKYNGKSQLEWTIEKV